jgi:hypothetical protein
MAVFELVTVGLGWLAALSVIRSHRDAALNQVVDDLAGVTLRQVVALGRLRDGERSGRDLRADFAGLGDEMTGPQFYRMMAELEDAGLVEGWYEPMVVDGLLIQGRRYRITGAGESVLRRADAGGGGAP